MKYYCRECEKELKIEEKDLIPNRGWDYNVEEYLLFYVMCPKCKRLNVYEECTSTDKELIPSDMKLRLMKKYAYVSDEYLRYYEKLRELEEAKAECERLKSIIENIQNKHKDNERLFSHWKDSEEIVEEVSKLQLKMK